MTFETEYKILAAYRKMEALDYKLNNKSRITDLSSKEKVEGKMSVYFG